MTDRNPAFVVTAYIQYVARTYNAGGKDYWFVWEPGQKLLRWEPSKFCKLNLRILRMRNLQLWLLLLLFIIIIIIIGFIAHTKLQMVGTRVANKVNIVWQRSIGYHYL